MTLYRNRYAIASLEGYQLFERVAQPALRDMQDWDVSVGSNPHTGVKDIYSYDPTLSDIIDGILKDANITYAKDEEGSLTATQIRREWHKIKIVNPNLGTLHQFRSRIDRMPAPLAIQADDRYFTDRYANPQNEALYATVYLRHLADWNMICRFLDELRIGYTTRRTFPEIVSDPTTEGTPLPELES